MSHNHDHASNTQPTNYGNLFKFSIGLNLLFVAIEVVYGVSIHSLALLADAGHNLSDVLSLVLAWAALALSQRLPTKRHTYGLKSSSILASLFNALLLLVAVGAIAWESIGRFSHPIATSGSTVATVAFIGILINSVSALLFLKGRHKDLNIKGAFLHMAADALVSLGVMVAGIINIYTGWLWLDPAVSLLIVGVIILGSWSLLRESLDLALAAVPKNIDRDAIYNYLTTMPGVVEVHDLHIWAMSTTETVLSAHLVICEKDFISVTKQLDQVGHVLEEKFQIAHPTIQIEIQSAGKECHLASEVRV